MITITGTTIRDSTRNRAGEWFNSSSRMGVMRRRCSADLQSRIADLQSARPLEAMGAGDGPECSRVQLCDPEPAAPLAERRRADVMCRHVSRIESATLALDRRAFRLAGRGVDAGCGGGRDQPDGARSSAGATDSLDRVAGGRPRCANDPRCNPSRTEQTLTPRRLTLSL